MPFPVDIQWIKKTEQKLGVEFPPSFVVAMNKDNGGNASTEIDEFDLFPFFDASDKKRLKRTCNSIDRETASARVGWHGFPADCVAIGTNGGGDFLVLKPFENAPERLEHTVYWWDHETGRLSAVADDFSELEKR